MRAAPACPNLPFCVASIHPFSVGADAFGNAPLSEVGFHSKYSMAAVWVTSTIWGSMADSQQTVVQARAWPGGELPIGEGGAG
eukprot:10760564-Alexandrium_andersonii.AAC.1